MSNYSHTSESLAMVKIKKYIPRSDHRQGDAALYKPLLYKSVQILTSICPRLMAVSLPSSPRNTLVTDPLLFLPSPAQKALLHLKDIQVYEAVNFMLYPPTLSISSFDVTLIVAHYIRYITYISAHDH